MTNHTLFHVTHWKAGSQWIYKILRELAPDRIVAPRVGEGQFLYDPLIPGAIYPTVYVTKEQFERVEMPPDACKFVVLRDLRDTLVSAYFSTRYSHSILSEGMRELRDHLGSISIEAGMSLMAEKWLIGSAVIHASWLTDQCAILRYEELLIHDAEILEEVLIARYRLGVDPEELKLVVKRNRFEALTGGRKYGVEDVLAHERKGIAGDWRNYFTRAMERRFDELFGPLVRKYEQLGADSNVGSPVVASQRITREEVLDSYDVNSSIHPTAPSYSHWLAWERAAFMRFPIAGKILDLGCTDIGIFNSIVPRICDAIGISTNSSLVEAAKQSGRYSHVNLVANYESLPADLAVDLVYSRTSLIFVPSLERTLDSLLRCLKPGGSMICSVITPKYVEWHTLPALFELAGFPDVGRDLRRQHLKFHGVVYSLSISQWQMYFETAGYEVVVCLPIVPRYNAQANLLVDALWHIPARNGGELGDSIAAYLSARPGFRYAMRGVIDALLELDSDWDDTAGAVFLLRKAEQSADNE